ncbi:MAG: polysaccharide deacetylase family protein [Acidobacteriota bacterium]
MPLPNPRRVLFSILLAALSSHSVVARSSTPDDQPATPSAEKADRRMVVTVDDLPAQRMQGQPPARITRLNRDLVDVLVEASIPAIGFVNERKLEVDGKVDPRRVDLLTMWLDAGLELGNHTYSHPSLHDTPRADYERDILKGERVTKALADEHDLPWRYFRHPFLRTGLDLETKQGVEAFLAEHGYRVAPVTIDNSEWIFARAYDEALDREDPALARRIGTAYVDYMVAMTEYYEGQSRALFEREIPQVVLIHANALNGDHLAPLVERWTDRGYRFVDLETTLADPAYASDDAYIGRGGITWLHRWAITRGVDRSIFRGEPATPDWVQEVAGIDE